MESLESLKRMVDAYAQRQANSDGVALAPFSGLHLMRIAAPTGKIRSVYRPLVCLVLQGEKQLVIGRERWVVAGGQSILVGADAPVEGRILAASRARPYLAVAVELDLPLMQSLAADLPATHTRTKPPRVLVDQLREEVADNVLRMLKLFDKPQAHDVVLPLLRRELHYWLLSGPQGAALRGFCAAKTNSRHITAAISLLRKDFRKPLAIGRLAAVAHMSPASFHRHFRAVTSLSPLQFQKQLRLIEARSLMTVSGLLASRAAFEVGYESVTQFTREYKRMFGEPPKRDALASQVARAAAVTSPTA